MVRGGASGAGVRARARASVKVAEEGRTELLLLSDLLLSSLSIHIIPVKYDVIPILLVENHVSTAKMTSLQLINE